MSKDRLETFSDGVFSFVLTLLFIRLVAPQIPHQSTLGQYAAAMAPLIPAVVSFVLTFAVICIHWINHHYLFSHIGQVTVQVVWLNNLLLLWLCFLPFTTSFLGEHPTDQFPVLLYGIDSLLMALTFYGLRSYASRQKLFTVGSEEAEALGPIHSVPAIATYVLSIILTFLNIYLALACLFILPLMYLVPTFVQLPRKG